MAIREALAPADDLYVANIQVALDSKVVVEDIRDNNPTVYGAIIHEIAEHRSNFHTCNIDHELRSSNVPSQACETRFIPTSWPACLAKSAGWTPFRPCKHCDGVIKSFEVCLKKIKGSNSKKEYEW